MFNAFRLSSDPSYATKMLEYKFSICFASLDRDRLSPGYNRAVRQTVKKITIFSVHSAIRVVRSPAVRKKNADAIVGGKSRSLGPSRQEQRVRLQNPYEADESGGEGDPFHEKRKRNVRFDPGRRPER
jgi:hypothetical protein